MTPQDGFIAMLEGRLQRMETDITEIKLDVKALTKWRIQVTTIAIVASTAISAIFKFIFP